MGAGRGCSINNKRAGSAAAAAAAQEQLLRPPRVPSRRQGKLCPEHGIHALLPYTAQLLPITVTHVQGKPSPPPMGVFAVLTPPGPALRQAAPLPVSVPRLPAFPRSGPRPLSRPLKAVAVPLRAASAETLFGAGVWAGRAQRPPWRRLLLLRLKSSPFSARPSRPPRPISCQFRSARPGPTTPGAAPFRPAAADADALAGSFGRKETPRRRVGAAADNAPSSSPLPPSLPCLDAAEDEHYGLQREEAGG